MLDAKIIIVGSGFAGIGLAIKLKEAGQNDFIILERADDVGGTWRDNRYPGSQCDVPSHLYSYSWRTKADWSRVFAPAPEIWEYIRECAREAGVLPHIRFDHEMLSAHWDTTTSEWVVETNHGTLRSKLFVSCMGHLADEKLPDIPGIESFSGEFFHSSSWNHELELKGKRIGVVGTGASAIQIIPQMQKLASELVVFMRSAPYLIPRPDREYTDAEKRQFARDPELIAQTRADFFWGMENNYAQRRRVPKFIDEGRAMSLQFLADSISDPELLEKLTPKYELGCKRVLISNEFYPTFHQENVTLEASALASIHGNVAVSADGNEYELDVLIFATGFEAVEPPFAQRISGKDGVLMSKQWEQGMQAFASTTIHNFPNLLMMNGPNTGLGHNSVVYIVESQIEYIVGAVQYMDDHGIEVIEPKVSAEEEYVAAIGDRADGTIWLTGGCSNWYVDYRTNRLTVTWPDYAFAFRDANGRFDPAAYDLEAAH